MMDGALAYLVDTNVLIYAYDAADPAKRRRAIDVLAKLASSGLGALSVQVLGEFYINIVRKPAVPLSPQQARDTAIRLCRSWQVLDLTVRTHLDAVSAVTEHQMSYWDALIWATARQDHLPYVITEDQQHGRLVGEIRYLNPFSDEFDLSTFA